MVSEMNINTIYKRVGVRILLERKRNGFSQEDLAGMSHIDRTYLARIEEGKANPSLKVLWRIACKLRISISDLVRGV